MMGKGIVTITFIGLLWAISIIDIQKKQIYNETVAGLFVPAIVSFFVFPEIGLVSRLLGMVSVSGAMLILSLMKPGSFGGGDIKMMIPTGLLLGLEGIWKAWIIAVLAAGVYSLLTLAMRKKVTNIPFGPFLCIGSLFRFLCCFL